MSQVIGLARPLCKAASAETEALDAAIRSDALKDILTVGGVAAAGGLGLRGLLGAKYMFGRKKPSLNRSLGPTVVSVPYPVYSNPLDEGRAQARALKQAADKRLGVLGTEAGTPPTGPGVAGALGTTALVGGAGLGAYGLYRLATRKKRRAAAEAEAEAADEPVEKAALLQSRSELPWYLPGVTLAGIGGLAGGYKLMDYMMDKKRKEDLAAEVEDAKAQYRETMLSQYDPASIPSADDQPPQVPLPTKTVNAPPGVPKLSLKSAALQTDLDALVAEAERVGTEKRAMPGWAGKGLGVYGTLASLLALGSGAAAYKFTKDRSTNKLVEDAIKQRERERWARRPPEIYAVPTPVRLTRGGDINAGPTPELPGTQGL